MKNGEAIAWVSLVGTLVLGVYFVSGRELKCCFDQAKQNFFRSFNAIFSKVGRSASEEVFLSLYCAKCVPILLYIVEACPVNKRTKKAFDFSMLLLLSHSSTSLYPALYLDSSTACTIATYIVHYCNSLYYKLPKSQLSRLQQIQNSVARTVVKAPKSCHITPIIYALSTGSESMNVSNTRHGSTMSAERLNSVCLLHATRTELIQLTSATS